MKHHDFYLLNLILDKHPELAEHVAPISWMREPGSRMVSQFFFAQQIKVLRKDYDLEDYVWRLTLDPEWEKGANELFADGANGAMWFAGVVRVLAQE